jgi:hypothetical protein
MFVEVEWDGDTLAVPLSQIEPSDLGDMDSAEAVTDLALLGRTKL